MMRRLNLRQLFFSVLFSVITVSSLSAQQLGETDVILQGFYWNTNPGDINSNNGVWWDTLANAATELSNSGFKTVWTPPANKGFVGVYDMGYGTYDYYDFGSFDQKGAIRTRHGNTSQLQAMIDALHQQGLNVMADVVLNHRGGAEATQIEDCDDGGGLEMRFTEFRPASNRLPADAPHFHPNSFPGHCDLSGPYHDRVFFEDICYFSGLDQVLDGSVTDDGWYHGPHNLGIMGDSLIVWGRYLLDVMGFDELRLDAVKHIEPGFLAPFLAEMGQGEQPFAVGELFDGDVNTLKSYRDQVESFNTTFGAGSKDANLAIFDFALRYALRDMANGGGGFDMWNLNSSGLRFNPNGGLPGEDIVTFVENHDVDRIGWVVVDCNDPTATHQIGSTCLKFSQDSGHDPVFTNKHMAYAYIMAAEGRPSVFYKDWFWFGLDEEIKWQMALRSGTATGGSAPIQNLNPFFVSGNGGDLFVLNRYKNNNQGGLVLAMNDNTGAEFAAFVDTPFQDEELKDYSDAYLFFQTTVFNDTRCFVKAGPSNYAWYAPTGQYPQPPGEAPSSFTLGNHIGAKLHFVTIRAEDAAQLIVNGAPIALGDEIAILPMETDDAVGLGRIGQSFRWDGVHDVIIEVLGGGNAFEAKGGLLNGAGFRVAVYDQSAGEMVIADNVTFASSGTDFDFSAKRPGSRGGTTPFSLTTNHGSQTYNVGGISLITALEAGCDAPTASCTNTSIGLNAMGQATLNAGQVDAGSTTDCDLQSLTVSPNTFNCGQIGGNTVTLTITDVNDLSATCTAQVAVADGIGPDITCPMDISVSLDGSCQFTLPDYTNMGVVMDNCDAGLPVTQMPMPGTVISSNTQITLMTVDISENPGSCSFYVNVADNQPPSLTCPGNQLELPNGNCQAFLSDYTPMAVLSDNCDGAPFITQNPSPSTEIIGQTTVTLETSDMSGNSTSCSFSVSIEDNTPPGIVCPADQSETFDMNCSFTLTDYTSMATATDNCDAMPSISQMPIAGTAISENTTVVLTVTDAATNTATCSFSVTLEDDTKPSITCPGDIEVGTDSELCSATVLIPTPLSVSDNCTANPELDFRYRMNDGVNAPGGWSSWQESTHIILDLGRWQVQWRATDEAGNSKRCSFFIEVQDDEPPLAACQDLTVEFNGENSRLIQSGEVWDEMNSTDNCDEVSLLGFTPAEVNCGQIGQIVPVLLTVEDDAGNTGQCTAMITVDGLPCGWSAPPGGINCFPNEADYNPTSESFSVTSDGCYDPSYYSNTDSHGFAGMELCGNGEIIAQVTQVDGSGWAGISIREDLSASAKMIQLSIDGTFLTKREMRLSTGGIAFNHLFATQGKNWLRLTRNGNTFGAYHSLDGINWSAVIIANIPMTSCIEVGLITENGTPTGSVTGTFSDVMVAGYNGNLTAPAPQPDIALETFSTDWSVYPNPTTGEVVVQLTKPINKRGQVQVYNNLGQVVKTIDLGVLASPVQQLDLSGREAGIYLFRLQINGQDEGSRRVVLMK